MRGLKIGNEYVAALRDLGLYEDTPKAVFAALVFSYASVWGSTGMEDPIAGNETRDHELIRARILNEWRILHENGIVPQKAPATEGRR